VTRYICNVACVMSVMPCGSWSAAYDNYVLRFASLYAAIRIAMCCDPHRCMLRYTSLCVAIRIAVCVYVRVAGWVDGLMYGLAGEFGLVEWWVVRCEGVGGVRRV
jgi:hypothetical protein